MHEFSFPIAQISTDDLLGLKRFKEMDYFAVRQYGLPLELMMENAGLHLAKVAAAMSGINDRILIGVGPGNNGSGGLVAARRLKAWGYDVGLDVWKKGSSELWNDQFARARKIGVEPTLSKDCDVLVDAYLGFSQRFPLEEELEDRICKFNASTLKKLSLDLPTGWREENMDSALSAHVICTLAAPKRILFSEDVSARILVADLGIPKIVYDRFEAHMLPFSKYSVVEVIIA